VPAPDYTVYRQGAYPASEQSSLAGAFALLKRTKETK